MWPRKTWEILSAKDLSFWEEKSNDNEAATAATESLLFNLAPALAKIRVFFSYKIEGEMFRNIT